MNKLILVNVFCFCLHFINAQEPVKIDSSANTANDARIEKLIEDYRSSYKLKGFRVQIYSGDKKGQRQTRLSFSQRYKEITAHESYNQPFFKVRVGDFKTKLEALKFKKSLVKDYPNCFIVNDHIDINAFAK